MAPEGNEIESKKVNFSRKKKFPWGGGVTLGIKKGIQIEILNCRKKMWWRGKQRNYICWKWALGSKVRALNRAYNEQAKF